MPQSRLSAYLLAALVALASAAYYGIVAFAPHLLAGRLAGYPVALVLALALFVLFVVVTLGYTWTAHDQGATPR